MPASPPSNAPRRRSTGTWSATKDRVEFREHLAPIVAGHTSDSGQLVAAIARPVAARIINVRVWRYLDLDTRRPLLCEPACARPVVAGCIEKRIIGHFNGNAFVPDLTIAAF